MMFLEDVHFKVQLKGEGQWEVKGPVQVAELREGYWTLKMQDGLSYMFAADDALFVRWKKLEEGEDTECTTERCTCLRVEHR